MKFTHSSTHASQMYAAGPAISFFTSCWLLPQKEQWRVLGRADSCAPTGEGRRSSSALGLAASILADMMFQFAKPNVLAISSSDSLWVISTAFAFNASRKACAMTFASRKSRIRAPLHRRTEEIGACLADPFANGEGGERLIRSPSQ